MFCTNCGNQIADGSAFCPYCGTSFASAQPAQPQQAPAQPFAAPAAPAPEQGTYQPPQYQQPQQPQYQPYGQQYQQPQYGTPAYDPNNPYAYGQAQGVSDKEVQSTRTLGIVALVVGIFIPLVGYICGGIGLSKARKLSFFANPEQQEALNKSKTLCTLGVVIPAVINLALILFSTFANN